MQTPNPEEPRDDYDSPWKDAVEHYFPEFMAFYFPDACQQINWQCGFEFLDQELLALCQDAELGKRYVDKLVKVTLNNGADQWVYIHVEVQGTAQKEFAERLFVYNYRIYDRYRRPVVSLAVLADDQADWKPNRFGYEVLGCKHFLEFPIAKLTDNQENLSDLLHSSNAFAIITAAHILTRQTRKDSQKRYQAKSQLLRLLYQKQWDKQRVIDLFWLLDWLMRLPEHLEKQLRYEIQTLEESQKMRYVSSFERFAREEGRQEGVLEGEAKLLKKQLVRRFGELPDWVAAKLLVSTEQDIDLWAENVLTATSLAAVFDDGIIH